MHPKPELTPDEEIASAPGRLSNHLAFLQLCPEDRERLRAIAPILNASSDQFVEAFYAHLFSFKDTAKFLQDRTLVARLKEFQKAHLESMLQDDVDDAYIDRRRKVGEVHAQVGINPQMFLGAYNQYLQYGLRSLAAEPNRTLDDFVEQVLSLLKAVFLDAELTLEAYFFEATRDLRQALDMVFRANTELRQFAQLTSHDLKTPLATVANLCDETLDEFGKEMPDEACRLIEMAKQRTYRMSTMIDELLELSAPADDLTVDDQVDLEKVVAEAVERLTPEMKRRQVAVSIVGSLPTVWGNRVRIREAIVNVLSNAVKFADKQPATIQVSAESTNDACTIKIADNGPGIPNEDLDRIFSPFRRLRMHQDRPGTGLGLYFARNLIEQDGGRIWAESQLGKGSVFHMTFRRRG